MGIIGNMMHFRKWEFPVGVLRDMKIEKNKKLV